MVAAVTMWLHSLGLVLTVTAAVIRCPYHKRTTLRCGEAEDYLTKEGFRSSTSTLSI